MAACAFLLAGTIKGTVGIGLPTASIGILAQVIDPRIAIALVVFPIMVTNAWQVYRSGGIRTVLRRYWLFAICLMAVLWATTYVTAAVSTDTLILALGGVIIVFALTNLLFTPPEISDRFDRPAQVVFGTLAGILGGLTAIWAPPMVIYFISRRIGKDEFVSASGGLIFLGSLPLCAGYWHAGLLNGPYALMSLAMVVPALAGFSIGEQIRKRLADDRFRVVVLLIFLGMGLNLVRRAIF